MASAFSEIAPRPRRFRCARALLVAALAVCLLGVLAWIARAPLLQNAARWWIVSENHVTPADAVVVLGGGIETRPFAAAEYYHKGLARKILVSDVRLTRSERLGIFSSQRELNQIVLMQLGVPEEKIEALGTANRNTRDEAFALRQWADRTQAKTVIVPTEIFSSRRVKWMMETALNGSGARVQVPALDSEDYGLDNWWQHELGLIAFQNEALKYVYYRFRY
jgi:uncharacterized SAM-binding protein YcdF (DUF218 family)